MNSMPGMQMNSMPARRVNGASQPRLQVDSVLADETSLIIQVKAPAGAADGGDGDGAEYFRPGECIENALIVSFSGRCSCLHFLQQLVAWLVCTFTRVIMIKFLHISAQDKCSRADRTLLVCGVLLFAMHRMQELVDELITFLYYFGCCEMSEGEGSAPAVKPPHGFVQAFTLAVLSLKFVIELCVSIAGLMFVVGSATNEEVILNCLAVTFVSEIDENFYKCFASQGAKEGLRALPEKKVNAICGGETPMGCLFEVVKWVSFGMYFAIGFHFIKPCPLEDEYDWPS